MLIFPKMNQVFPTKSKYDEYCNVLGVETIDENLYTHMMIEYGDSTFRASNDLAHEPCTDRLAYVRHELQPSTFQSAYCVRRQ